LQDEKEEKTSKRGLQRKRAHLSALGGEAKRKKKRDFLDAGWGGKKADRGIYLGGRKAILLSGTGGSNQRENTNSF